jgi:hypothetical protein
MSKIFLKTIIQYGGEYSLEDKITILNEICKVINKKIKKYEEHFGIDIDLKPLSENNFDCSPASVPMQGVAVIDGPIKGEIPYYTNVEIDIPVPQIVQTITPVPLTPFGPVIGVPGIGVNPFGSSSNSYENRLQICIKYLRIIQKICNELNQVITGTGIKTLDSVDKCYFEFKNSEDNKQDKFLEKMSKKDLIKCNDLEGLEDLESLKDMEGFEEIITPPAPSAPPAPPASSAPSAPPAPASTTTLPTATAIPVATAIQVDTVKPTVIATPVDTVKTVTVTTPYAPLETATVTTPTPSVPPLETATTVPITNIPVVKATVNSESETEIIEKLKQMTENLKNSDKGEEFKKKIEDVIKKLEEIQKK